MVQGSASSREGIPRSAPRAGNDASNRDSSSASAAWEPSRKAWTSWKLVRILSLAGLGIGTVFSPAVTLVRIHRLTYQDAKPSERVVDASERAPAAEDHSADFRFYAKTDVMYKECNVAKRSRCGAVGTLESCVEKVKRVCNEDPLCVGFEMMRRNSSARWRAYEDRDCVSKNLVFGYEGDFYLKTIVNGKRLADDEMPTRASVFASIVKLRKRLLKPGKRVNERIYFTHIPKNGGTYVEDRLRDTGFGATQVAPRVQEVGCTRYHQPLPVTIERGEEFFDPGMEIFAVVRHPYKRVSSQWKWLLSRRPEMLPYPRTIDGFNAWVVDMLKLVTGPDTHNNSALGATRGGRYHQDCHWLPQVDYIFSKDRKRQVVNTLLHFDYLDEELEAFLHRYGSNATLAFSNRSRTLSCFVACKARFLPNETLDLIDAVYAEDFDLLGFERLRGKALLSPDRYGFPRKGSFAALASDKTCASAVWLNKRSDRASRCGHLVQTRWNCSHAYFTYSDDGNCGCVADTAIDCAMPVNQRSIRGVRIFSITGGGQNDDLRCGLLRKPSNTLRLKQQ